MPKNKDSGLRSARRPRPVSTLAAVPAPAQMRGRASSRVPVPRPAPVPRSPAVLPQPESPAPQAQPKRTANAHPDTDLTLLCLIHDLNNVFQTLMEAADLLSDDPQWSPVSAAILRSIERGKEISASLETTGQPPVAIKTVVANAMALVRDSMIAGRGPAIEFACQIDPSLVLPRAWAWERVLINLFSNAVHAMPHGGTIAVRARRVSGSIEIAVADQGSGIAPEWIPAIFEPHVSSRSTGLGLHIVHTIVTSERGEVRVANRPQGGAEFTITLPIDRRRAVSAGPSKTRSARA